jgi:hypothetical protein
MTSSTKREVSHDPREIEGKHRRSSSRLNRKHPGSHSRKSYTPTEAKMPKIVKSSSSTEKAKLEHSIVLTKVALRSLKVMKIVRIATVTVNHHPKCPFGVHQTYLQELKIYLMQSTYVRILSH